VIPTSEREVEAKGVVKCKNTFKLPFLELQLVFLFMLCWGVALKQWALPIAFTILLLRFPFIY